MVIVTSELARRTYREMDERADIARLARNFSLMATFRLIALKYREML